MTETEIITRIVEVIGKSKDLTEQTHKILCSSTKKSAFKVQLKSCENLKSDILKLYKESLSLYGKYIEQPKSNKELMSLYTYVEGARLHLSIQQDDCNRLIYEIQQKDVKRDRCIAYCALGATVIFSIFSILCTICDWKCTKSDLPQKIECLSDSVRTTATVRIE